jgi:malate dehydrogenase
VDVAILGATGSCGRQVAAQLIERSVLPETVTVYLIGHAGGHETELWGLRADLRDAFADRAPEIEIGTDVSATGATVVVMMAGATVTRETKDRAALAATNDRIFAESAAAVGRMPDPVTVIVQSNPVESAVFAFAQYLPRERILGAAAWSDSLRFRRELAADLRIRRPMVNAQMWGQHGDYLVPVWSRVHARGVSEQRLADVIGSIRAERSLADLPEEIRMARAEALRLINEGNVAGGYSFIQSQPADVRAAVKPFFTHFTAGRTTELATAHAVVDIVEFLALGQQVAIPAQIPVEGEYGGLRGPLAVPVLLDPMGWSQIVDERIADDERAALEMASRQIMSGLRSVD